MDRVQMSINGRMEWSPHIIEYYSAIKENEVLIPAITCYNRDEPPEQDAKWKKPDSKDHALYNSTDTKQPE